MTTTSIDTMPDGRAETARAAHALLLLARFGREVTVAVPPALEQIGRGNTVLRVFLAIDDEAGSTPSEIAEQLGLDRSVVSRSLARLDAMRVLQRRVLRGDRRFVRVALTQRGRAGRHEYIGLMNAALRRSLPLVDDWVSAIDEWTGTAAFASSTPAVDREGPGVTVETAAVIDLLAQAGEDAVKAFVEVEKAVGVTGWEQRFALWVAEAHGSATAAQVAALLSMRSTTASSALSRLRAAGLVEIVPSEGAGDTVTRYRVTPRGRQLIEQHAIILKARLPRFLQGIALIPFVVTEFDRVG